jgi:hypothetical protein
MQLKPTRQIQSGIADDLRDDKGVKALAAG